MSKTALITGGSSGLGLAMARELGKKGYSLILIARNEQKLECAVQELKSSSYATIGYSCDITDNKQLQEVLNQLKQESVNIDLLILNAGVVTCKLLSDFSTPQELKHDLEINLWGTILSTYIFLPITAKGGRILMISSAFGLMGPAAYSVYAASKAGIINFAESLRRELLCKGISVHVTCPGDIDTPQLHEEHKKLPDWFKQNDPRKVMSPATAAKIILKKCFKNKFLIIINFEVFMLLMLNKLLPRRLRDLFVDRIFPLPEQND